MRVWKRDDGSTFDFREENNGVETADEVGRIRRGTIRRSGWILNDIGSAFRGEVVHAKIPQTETSQRTLQMASGTTHLMAYRIGTAKRERLAFGVREEGNVNKKVVWSESLSETLRLPSHAPTK